MKSLGRWKKMLGGSRITVRSQDGKNPHGTNSRQDEKESVAPCGRRHYYSAWSIQDEKADVVCDIFRRKLTG